MKCTETVKSFLKKNELCVSLLLKLESHAAIAGLSNEQINIQKMIMYARSLIYVCGHRCDLTLEKLHEILDIRENIVDMLHESYIEKLQTKYEPFLEELVKDDPIDYEFKFLPFDDAPVEKYVEFYLSLVLVITYLLQCDASIKIMKPAIEHYVSMYHKMIEPRIDQYNADHKNDNALSIINDALEIMEKALAECQLYTKKTDLLKEAMMAKLSDDPSMKSLRDRHGEFDESKIKKFMEKINAELEEE